jgi:hypothetical protein
VSQITELASGVITATDHLIIELVEANETPRGRYRPLAGQGECHSPAAFS